MHAVKGGLLSYCDKVYSRGNINQKYRIGGVMEYKVDKWQFSSFIGILSYDMNDLWFAKMSSLSKLVFL
jgi:hypothetical protein